ncbi:MAG: hypothetical protein FJ296_02305 [Planctomycetes bacterium]|nr:hypothetical protein [Planctomycetota bacterium]
MPERADPIVQQGDPREALQEVLRAIRRNKVRVAFTTAVVVLLGVALSLLWPNKYESSTMFVLRDWHVVADAVLLEELADIPLVKKLKTLENELRSRRRVEAVLNELSWPEWLDTAGKESDRRDLLLKIGENLVVAMDSDVTGAHNIVLTFAWTSPRKAKEFVNRLRDAWIQLTLESYKKRLEEQKDRMEGTWRERQADHTAALAAVKQYEREHGVPGLLSTDVNNQLRAQYEIELAKAKAELESVVGVVQHIEAEQQVLDKETLQPITPSTKQQAELLVKLQALEPQFKAATDPVTGYKPLHPKVKQLQSEYDSLLAQLKEAGYDPQGGLMELQVNPLWVAKEGERQVALTRERELTALVTGTQRELDEVKRRLEAIPVVTADLAQLNAEVDVKATLAGEALLQLQPLREKVIQLRAQSFGVDSQGLGTIQSGPFEILESGVEPEDPVLPVTAIILAVSLVLGILVGAMGPVLTEMTRSSFGTVKEVGRSLGVPVLGAVDLILTVRDLRAQRVQRSLTYVTMALVLVSLAAAIWIYHAHAEQLPDALRRTLREVRMALT